MCGTLEVVLLVALGALVGEASRRFTRFFVRDFDDD